MDSETIQNQKPQVTAQDAGEKELDNNMQEFYKKLEELFIEYEIDTATVATVINDEPHIYYRGELLRCAKLAKANFNTLAGSILTMLKSDQD